MKSPILKKIASFTIIALTAQQLSVATVCAEPLESNSPQTITTSSETPEQTLVENIVALSGSPQKTRAQKEVAREQGLGLIESYENTLRANPELQAGASERFDQAAAQMGIDTAQMKKLGAAIAANPSNSDLRSKLAAAEAAVSQLSLPSGSHFEADEGAVIMIFVIILVLVAAAENNTR